MASVAIINLPNKTSFSFTWEDNSRNSTMEKLCVNFSSAVAQIQEHLTGDELIDEIETARQNSLMQTFGTSEPNSKSYIHESRKLALLTYAQLSGVAVNEASGTWVDILRNGPPVEILPDNYSANGTVKVPYMNLSAELFIFPVDRSLQPKTVSTFCRIFGGELRNISLTDNKELLIKEIETAREKSLRKTFCGDTPRNVNYISFSDQIAVIALAIRLGHSDISTYQEAMRVTKVRTLRDFGLSITNGSQTPGSVASRVKWSPPANTVKTKDIVLKIAEKVNAKVYTDKNGPKPNELRIVDPFSKTKGLSLYTFLSAEDGELLGMGKIKRINPYTIIFQPYEKPEEAGHFYNSPLIVRELKLDEDIDVSKLKKLGHYISFNPLKEGINSMQSLSEGDIVEIMIDESKKKPGEYLAHHISDSGNLIIWLKDGRCIQARNNQVTIQPFKIKE